MYKIGITLRKENNEYKIKTRYLFLKNYEYIYLSNENFSYNLDKCDAFILTGGDDYNPKLYQNISTFFISIDDKNDNLDIKIIDYAVRNNIPILGICRGIQGINIYFNGTLFLDIPNHLNTNHEIVSIKNNKKYIVNSYHHQAIDKLGENLDVLFTSKDGIIEAVIHSSLPIIATQWHLEMDLENELNKDIINYFTKMIGEYYEKKH